MKNKKAQFEISFGMIFSIILIISFIAVAFYVIKAFLGMRDCSEIGRFYQDVQNSISKAYKSPETNDEITATLPKGIEYVCVVDVNSEARGSASGIYDMLSLVNRNFAIYPKTSCSGLGGLDMKYLDVLGLTSAENPFCIKVENRKIKFRVEKALYDKLVKITR